MCARCGAGRFPNPSTVAAFIIAAGLAGDDQFGDDVFDDEVE
jgi:hypothetical protein